MKLFASPARTPTKQKQQATADLCNIAFYFLLQVGECTKPRPELRDKVFQSKLIPVNQDEHLSTTRQAINFIRKNRNLSFGRY